MSEPRLDGYIKLHKKLLNSSIWQSRSAALKVIAVTCLLKANFKDTYWNNLIIKRGSFITSQRKLAQECNICRETLRDCLSTLKDTHFITQELTHHYSIITICNYEIYQTKKYHSHPLNHPDEHPQIHPWRPKLRPPGGLNKGHNLISNTNKEDSKANFVCKDCQNYDPEHLNSRGDKAGYCPELNVYLPPYSNASACANKKPIPAESEVKHD